MVHVSARRKSMVSEFKNDVHESAHSLSCAEASPLSLTSQG